jgi:hypothetical protein
VVVPVYLQFDPEPVAVFRAERVFSDYQTKGFFRIGALPLTVMEDLSIELKDPSRLPMALTALAARFAAKGVAKKVVEGHNFSLSFSKQQCRLRTRSVRLEKATEWALEDGIVSLPNAEPVRFRQGRLLMDGPEAGLIECQTTNGIVQLHVLSLIAD